MKVYISSAKYLRYLYRSRYVGNIHSKYDSLLDLTFHSNFEFHIDLLYKF